MRQRGACIACAGLLASACVLSGSNESRANGRYPAAGLVTRQPGAPERMAVRATYGLLTTLDGGDSWGWSCEEAVGFAGIQDPMVVATGGGALLVGVYEGLARSTDGGCSWSMAGGELEGLPIADLTRVPGNPDGVVALTSRGQGLGAYDTRLFVSLDDGATWTPFGAPLPTSLRGLTLDVAPSDPSVVYVSGLAGSDAVLARSTDGGFAWGLAPVPLGGPKALPFIGAIHPAEPDEVYVRLDRDPADAVLVTRDGGANYDVVVEGLGPLLGFALSPDGAELRVGGTQAGLLGGSTADLTLAPVSSVGAQCLAWWDNGLYACADDAKAGFSLGRSLDGGVTFEPMLLRAELCGHPGCSPDSGVAAECASSWPLVAAQLGVTECDSPWAGEGGAGTGGAGQAGSDPGSAASGGCTCASPGAARGSASLGLAACGVCAAAWLRARRRRSRRRGRRR
jgi:photosystem II stability/assembly factor-like uncharacterized protein